MSMDAAPTITEFLLARIAEDEEVARSAIDSSGWRSSLDGRWELVEVPYEGEWPRNPDAESVMWADAEWTIHASRHDPARVLAECAAKRGLVRWVNTWPLRPAPPSSVDGVLEMLAAVHSDHPDYRQEWALNGQG